MFASEAVRVDPPNACRAARRSIFSWALTYPEGMSKAFTKEPDEDLDAGAGEDEAPSGPRGLPPGAKNYITPAGHERLRAELHYLLHDERPKVVDVVAWAASNGDRSENADYQYGKRRLRQIDSRMRFLTKRLEQAEVVDPVLQQGTETVRFGATVTVLDEDDNERRHRIVGVDEVDAARGDVSWTSPVGRALLGAREGDLVTVRTPRGEVELEVARIEYLPCPAEPPRFRRTGGELPRTGTRGSAQE
jgi:transcription elongation factor GreB